FRRIVAAVPRVPARTSGSGSPIVRACIEPRCRFPGHLQSLLPSRSPGWLRLWSCSWRWGLFSSGYRSSSSRSERCSWPRPSDSTGVGFATGRFGAEPAVAPYARARLLLLFTGDARLFEVELALDLAARFVGNLAVAQQPIDILAFGGNEIEAQ